MCTDVSIAVHRNEGNIALLHWGSSIKGKQTLSRVGRDKEGVQEVPISADGDVT